MGDSRRVGVILPLLMANTPGLSIGTEDNPEKL